MRTVASLAVTAVILAGCWGPKTDNVEQAQKDVVYDEKVEREIRVADNLDADRNTMWRTVLPKGEPLQSLRTNAPANGPPRTHELEVSPVSAINAASRVFATVQLVGKTAQETAAALGARPRPHYMYDFPFWPVEKGTVVYRFDCGSCGWQFNLNFDAEGRVANVERLWIH